MNMKKRIFALTALVLSLILALCSCGARAIPSTDEESRVVGMCGEHEIRYEELRYLTMNYKAELKAMHGEGIFDSKELGEQYEDQLKALVAEALAENYALVELCESEDIRLSDKTSRKQVKEYVKESVDLCGGMDAYRVYLAENYMTDWVFRLNTAILGCQQRYYEVLAEKNDKQAYDAVMAGEGIIRCRSIFVKNDPGESISANRKAAQAVCDEIAQSGKTVEDFIGKKVNQDTSNCDYYFMKGYFLEEYEEAAFALDIGEVSGVVEVPDGFYVIQRVEPEEGYFSSHVEDLMVQYHISTMENLTQSIADTLSVAWNESIELWSMK